MTRAAASHPHSVRVALLAFLIIMVDGYDTLLVSFVAPLLTKEWGLKPTDLGAIFASGYFGAMIGAIGMGTLADRFGRKRPLIGALLLAAAATLGCALVDDKATLMLLRMVAGIGLGGALPALSSLTAEHSAPDRRHGTVTLMYIGFPLGAVVGGALTAAFLHHGWRAVFVAAGIACLASAALAIRLPESLVRGKADAPHPVGTRRRMMLFAPFGDGRLGTGLALALGLFGMLLVTYFLISWSPALIIARGGGNKIAALGGVVLNLGGICGAAVMAPIINRHGPYYPIALIVMLGTAFVAAIGYDFGSLPALFGLLFLTGICIMGGQLNFPAMTVDLYPQNVRGAGIGWTMSIGRIGSIVGPMLGGMLVTAGLPSQILFLLAAAVTATASMLLLIATRLRAGRQVDDADSYWSPTALTNNHMSTVTSPKTGQDQKSR